MIELKQNRIWSDSLSTILGLDKPWNEIEKPLQKFICFGEGGDSGGGDSSDDDPSVPPSVYSPSGPSGPLGEVPNSTSQSDDTGISDPATDAQSGVEGGLGPTTDDPFGDDLSGLDPGEIGQYGQDPFGGFDTTIGEIMDPFEFLGFEFDQFGFRGFKPGEFIADIIDVVNPFAGFAGRTIADVTGIANDLGLNTQNPLSEVASLAGNIGLTDVATAFTPTAQAIDLGIDSLKGGLADIANNLGLNTQDFISEVRSVANKSLSTMGVDIGPAPAQSPISASSPQTVDTTPTVPASDPVDDFNFNTDAEPDPKRPRGIASVLRNPLEVRPQQEVLPSNNNTSDLRRIRRRPFVFTPGRTIAQTGGGIQDLIDKQPTLIDVVNKGMSIPEETIPSQRPEQFIKGQQQPDGLRSTNYYTNAMQPASFYAQPQQVRNYGSIY